MNSRTDDLLLLESDLARATKILGVLAKQGRPHVQWAKSLSEGLQHLERHGAGAILLSLFLPDSRGIDTLDKARAAAGPIPILVLCDAKNEAIGRLAVERGADDFLPDDHLDSYSLTRAVKGLLDRRTTDALLAENRRADVMLNSIGDAVLSTDTSGNVTYLNAVAESMTGWRRAEAIGRPLVEVFDTVDGATREPPSGALVMLAIQENRSVNSSVDCILIRRDGHESPIEHSATPVYDGGGRVVGAVIVFRDATAASGMSVQLKRLAQHDVLTDLPNRGLLQDRLQQAIALARRCRHRTAVLFLDLDHFKHVNDSLGHVIGDQLLQAVALRLTGCVRRSDTVGRQGGDEFVVILSGLDAVADANISVAKMLAALTPPYHIGPHSLHAGVSIGVSIYPDDGEDAETLMNNADMAMYHAKDSGGRSYQFFRHDMTIRAVERQFIEAGLHLALERHEFSLHYQPKIDVATGAMTGAEALLRWRHPERGFISPGQFVPVAEDIGLILPIGQWVLREVCMQSRAWLDAGLALVPIAVNISAIEFRSKGFVARIRAILEDTGLDPHWLELELTESVLMKDAESTILMLKLLKNIGVRLTVDDFGTGYSSLSYLRQFPIDALKVDQSFVHEISPAAQGGGIVSAVINMGNSLKKRVIAEGVETREQLDFLASEGCEEAQGYYFNRPMVGDQFAALLRSASERVIVN